MGKPRPGDEMTKPLIINRPDVLTLRQRFADGFLTFLFWLIWFYLWIPLLSLGGWIFGIDLFHDEMIVREGLQSLTELLGWYLLVIFLISTTLGVWAMVNLWRFRGKDRRGARPVVADEVLANDFNVTAEQVNQWRACKRLVISHDPQGNIMAVENEPLEKTS